MHTCWRVPSDKRRIVIPPVSGSFKVVGEFSKENPREYMLDLSSNVSAGEAGGERTTKCAWLPWDSLGKAATPARKPSMSTLSSAERVNHPKVIVSTA